MLYVSAIPQEVSGVGIIVIFLWLHIDCPLINMI